MTERHVLDVTSADEWQDWLTDNHETANEVWVRLFNKNAAAPGMSYSEAVEVALCFGWIDSLARGYDDVSRIQRFSPRRPHSGWSKLNVARVQRRSTRSKPRAAGRSSVMVVEGRSLEVG